MNKLIELAAILLGGTSFFAVCFVGFAAFSGTPLNEVPVVGQLLPAPDEPQEGAKDAEHAAPETKDHAPETPKEHEDRAPRPPREELALLSTWSLPSPFSAEELLALVDQLKAQRLELDQREAQLALRESGIQEREEQVADEGASLTRLRKDLESYELDLATREFEVQRLEKDAADRQDARWADVGGVIAALESSAAGERLGKYTPEEAAQILRSIDEDKAVEILNQLQGDRWKEYVDAYTREAKKEAGRPRK